MSKTWFISMISQLIIQYGAAAESYIPTLTGWLVAFIPEPFASITAQVVPLILSWLITMALMWARNDAVKKGTKASVLTGKKSLWEK